jgi:hypothetical protein
MMISCTCAPFRSLLTNREDLTGTSQPTLGVIFFALSPLSYKGAMHKHNQKNLAPISPCKAEPPLSLFRDGYANSHKKNQSKKFRHHNFTHTSNDPILFVGISFIKIFIVSTCQLHIKFIFF